MIKTWLITGASSGLGRELAEYVLSQGHQVIATARQVESLHDLKVAYPELCQTRFLDVTRRDEIPSIIMEAATCFSSIDVLVNNAGIGLVGALEEVSKDQIERVFSTNFFGGVTLMRAVLPVMRQQKRGHILNMSAIAGFANEFGFSIYGASKFALEGVSEALRAEVRPLGIKVTVVEPGPFRTPFITRSVERATKTIPDYAGTSGKFAEFLKKIDGQQPGDPRKAAQAIFRVVEAEQPPLRLVLGKFAYEKISKKIDQVRGELEAWKEISLPTDFSS